MFLLINDFTNKIIFCSLAFMMIDGHRNVQYMTWSTIRKVIPSVSATLLWTLQEVACRPVVYGRVRLKVGEWLGPSRVRFADQWWKVFRILLFRIVFWILFWVFRGEYFLNWSIQYSNTFYFKSIQNTFINRTGLKIF